MERFSVRHLLARFALIYIRLRHGCYISRSRQDAPASTAARGATTASSAIRWSYRTALETFADRYGLCRECAGADLAPDAPDLQRVPGQAAQAETGARGPGAGCERNALRPSGTSPARDAGRSNPVPCPRRRDAGARGLQVLHRGGRGCETSSVDGTLGPWVERSLRRRYFARRMRASKPGAAAGDADRRCAAHGKTGRSWRTWCGGTVDQATSQDMVRVQGRLARIERKVERILAALESIEKRLRRLEGSQNR